MISVLYIDDEQGLLEIARSFLELSGEFRVVTLASAEEALISPSILSYDAIVSDYQMPGMDGIAFLKAVRARSGDIPFILFTGRGREEVVIEAINNGANFYLQKGGDAKAQFAELAHKIRQAVRMRQAQVSLAEQEQRYHDIQNANDLIQSIAPDGHFQFVNKKWQDTLGYEEHELKDLTIFDIIHEECQEHCKSVFPRVIAGENVGIIDLIFKTRTGKKVYAEGIVTCKITDGQPQYTRGIFKDVTDRKNAESALRVSEEKFRTLVEYSLDVILIIDFQGTILFANRTLGTILDIPDYQALLGKRNVLEFIAPESRDDVIRDMGNVAQGIDAYLVHYKFITETKREGWVECLGKKIPFQDSWAMFVSLRDITDRKRAESAIRESENRFRGIFETSPYPIAINSMPDMKFEAVNAAFLKTSGYTEAEILGKNPVEMGLLSLVEAARLASNAALRGKVENVPLVVTAKGNRKAHVIFSTVPVTINDRMATLTMIAETTQLKRVEEELLQKNEDLNAAFEEITATEEELRQYNDELRKNEEVLRASEEKFRSLVEYSLEGILILDFQGQILFANSSAARTIEIDHCAELVGRNVMEFIAPASRQDVIRDFGEVARGHDAYLAQYQVITANGKKIFIESIGKVITYEGKTADLISIRDITERKATEAVYHALSSSMAGTTGLDSLQKLTENISSWLGTDCVMVGEIQPDNETVKVLAMLLDGKDIADFTYSFRGTPCGNVAVNGFCQYPDNVTTLFPDSRILSEFNIRGYIGTPLKNSSGKVIGILCALSRNPVQSSPAVQEIMGTIAMKAAAEIERLRIERALRESEGKFRTLVENSLDGILIVDLTGKILFRNRAAVNIVDAVIKPDRASTKNVLDFIAPESRAQVLHDFSQVASGIDSFPMNYQVVTSTGKKIWVESIGKQIVFHDSPAAIVSLRDITDRKLAEEALRESREKFRSFVENANEIVFSLTPDGIISYVSPKWTEFMGDDTGELIGKPASGFIHPDDIPQCRELFLRTINTGESGGGIEYRVRHKNGTWLWHTLSGSPIRDTGGDVVAYLGICHDITERRKIENALRQANKKLNLLSSINRHDINNQLMVLNGFVELLHKKVPEPTFEYYFSSITKASNQIMSMIQFTKEYEKIGVRAPVWHDLRALVKNSAEGAMLGEVTLKNDLPADTEVFFDPLIVKVFFNLIDNALRHGRGITAIRFSFETRNGDRIIICEDDGTGISTGEKEKIFDLGFGKNTGFGLAISREILDITGISIRETGVPGRGARFEIIVPEGAYRIRAGR